MTQLLLASSTVALVLLVVHSWRTRGRFVTLAFFISATIFGVIRGNAIWLLGRFLTDESSDALKPYIPQEGLIPQIGHESLQVAVGWVFTLYLAWTVSELILRRLPRFAGRVFMISGLSALFVVTVCYCMETTAATVGWWCWELPTRTMLFGIVNIPAMEGWFSIVPCFLMPFLVIVCSATAHRRLRWLWLAVFPIYMLGHFLYTKTDYAYPLYNVFELFVVLMMMFGRLRMARGEIAAKEGDRLSGMLLAAALVIFFGVLVLGDMAFGGGVAKTLTVLPMLMLCLLAWRRMPAAWVLILSLVGVAGWLWMGPRALWTLVPATVYGFLVILERRHEAWWLRWTAPLAVVALATVTAILFAIDKDRQMRYVKVSEQADRLAARGLAAEASAAWLQADRSRPRDLLGFYTAVREMTWINQQDPRRAALAIQRRLPRIIGEFEEAVRRDPEWLAPRQELTCFYLMDGRAADVTAQYREMHRLRPTDPDIAVMLGYRLLREGNVVEAQEVCEKACRLKRPPVEAMVNLGVIRFSQGRDEEARKLWEEALKREPRQPIAWLNIERAGANPSYRDIDMRYLAQLAAGATLAPWFNGLAAYGSGYSTGDRLRLVAEAAALDPTWIAPQRNLVHLYLQEGPRQDKERALWHARRMMALAGSSQEDEVSRAQNLLLLGRALRANGKPDEARRAFDEGRSIAPPGMLPQFDRFQN